jgi:hypothetical protein
MDTFYVNNKHNFAEQLLASQGPTLLAVKLNGGSSSCKGGNESL